MWHSGELRLDGCAGLGAGSVWCVGALAVVLGVVKVLGDIGGNAQVHHLLTATLLAGDGNQVPVAHLERGQCLAADVEGSVVEVAAALGGGPDAVDVDLHIIVVEDHEAQPGDVLGGDVTQLEPAAHVDLARVPVGPGQAFPAAVQAMGKGTLALRPLRVVIVQVAPVARTDGLGGVTPCVVVALCRRQDGLDDGAVAGHAHAL